MAETFKPSQVSLTFSPLTNTMGKAETEQAAACVVRVCQARGDTWQPVTFAMVKEVFQEDIAAKREPFASLAANPFFRPQIARLVDGGFCTLDGDAATLTEAAFRAMAPWVLLGKAVP